MYYNNIHCKDCSFYGGFYRCYDCHVWQNYCSKQDYKQLTEEDMEKGCRDFKPLNFY